MADEQGPKDAGGQTGEAERPNPTTPGDDASSRVDWKRLYLESKSAVEERNRLKAEVEELKQSQNRPPNPATVPQDPAQMTEEQLQYLANVVKDPLTQDYLSYRNRMARELAWTNARIEIARKYAADADEIEGLLKTGAFNTVDAAADAFYGRKYKSERSEREKSEAETAARKRAQEEAKKAADAAPGTATQPAAGSPKSGPMKFSDWNNELALARQSGNAARTKELLDLASRKQIGEG